LTLTLFSFCGKINRNFWKNIGILGVEPFCSFSDDTESTAIISLGSAATRKKKRQGTRSEQQGI